MAFSTTKQLLPQVFDEKSKIDPHGIFAKVPMSSKTYKEGFRGITHLEMATAINYVARLFEEKFGKGKGFETIAYIGPNDPAYNIVLIAGIKTGYKIFLPSPRNSTIGHLSMLSKLDCVKLVCTNPEAPCIPPIQEQHHLEKLHIPSLFELLDLQDVPLYPYVKTFEEECNNPILVLHTSGSTGIPKPLIYNHHFITRLWNNNSISAPPGFRVLDEALRSGNFFITIPAFHAAGFGYGLCVSAFWGCTPIYPLPGAPPTLDGFVEAIQYVDTDWAMLPPVVIDLLSKDTNALDIVASKLKHLYYTGGGLPQASGDIVTSKIPLYQSLASSEFANYVLLRPDSDQTFEDWNWIQPHPSLHVEFQRRFDDLYELVVIRNNASDDHQPVFSLFPQLQEYGTRDLFTSHPTKPGLWRHQGRIDDVIVFINGEKTNPVSFEQDVSRHPEVRSALVVGEQRFEASLLIELAANKERTTKEEKEIIESIWPIVQEANTKCPAHARVAKSNILLATPDMPFARAGKGTVQRQGTWNLYAEKLDKLYTEADFIDTTTTIDVSDQKAVILAVRDAVSEVASWSDANDIEDFFALGMDSLQVIRLGRSLKALFPNSAIEASTIYANPSIRLLTEIIAKPSDDNKVKSMSRKDAIADMRNRYEKSIDVLAGSRTNGFHSTSNQASLKTVILTGSTGALGSYILQNLLHDKSVGHVYCFNRGANSKTTQVTRNKERQIPSNFDSSRVTFLTVDLTESSFGLDTANFRTVLSSVTNIIHNAWPVDFNRALQSFIPSLDGVLKLVSFASQASLSPSILFISSIASASNYQPTASSSSLIPETMLDDDAPASMGYGESKYLAERMLDYAAKKLSITAGIVRVGQVAGTAENPRGWNRNEWFPSLVLSSKYIGALPKTLGSTPTEVDWIPIDRLSSLLVELTLSLRKKAGSSGMHTFHAINPNSVSWESLLLAAKNSLQAHSQDPLAGIDVVPYSVWVGRLQKSAAKGSEGTLDVDSNTIYQNPGIKLLDFYESLLVKDKNEIDAKFDVQRTLETIPSLGKLETIQAEWMAGWIRGWI